MALVSFVKRHRYAVIHYGVLLVVAAVCVPLLIVVPEARAYTATLLAWTLAFAVRLWQWLPWERASVRHRAHRRADALMREKGVGSVYGNSKSLPSAPTPGSWSLLTVAHGGEGGNQLLPPWGAPEGGGDGGCAREPNQSLRRKFLLDTSDEPSSLRCLGDSKPGREGDAVASCTVMTAAAPIVRRGASPPPRISASALEASSQFLALSTSASPLRGSLPPPPAPRRSHEPFTHVSRRSPSLRTADTSLLSTPSLSTIAPEEEATAGAPPLPSLSPASSRRTHGYVPPPSLPDSPPPSPLVDRNAGGDVDDGAASSVSSAPRVASRLSFGRNRLDPRG